MKKSLLFLPLIIFTLILALFFKGLFLNPSELPSNLINKNIPTFSLKGVLDDRFYTQNDIQGPALLNIWATWCYACYDEHPVLNKISQAGVKIIGINYKDNDQKAIKWLNEFHNPYTINISDKTGSLAIDLGVYGAPETFFIDKNNKIIHRFVGTITEEIWHEELQKIYESGI